MFSRKDIGIGCLLATIALPANARTISHSVTGRTPNNTGIISTAHIDSTAPSNITCVWSDLPDQTFSYLNVPDYLLEGAVNAFGSPAITPDTLDLSNDSQRTVAAATFCAQIANTRYSTR